MKKKLVFSLPVIQESPELLKQIEEVKSFCAERGYFFTAVKWENVSDLLITIEDKYNSQQMRNISAYCKSRGWKAAEQISNRSRNIYEAFFKAEAKYNAMKAAGENYSELLRKYLDYLIIQIAAETLAAYQEKMEKQEKKPEHPEGAEDQRPADQAAIGQAIEAAARLNTFEYIREQLEARRGKEQE